MYVATQDWVRGDCIRMSRYCSSTMLSEDVMKRTDSVCLDGYTGCMLDSTVRSTCCVLQHCLVG